MCSSPLKILAVIANHGAKNRHFVARLIETYRAMAHQVDIVVLSNVEKDLGPGVEVRVGAPLPDPWSLPFGYKKIFLERQDRYDLFIYSEDDTLITEGNIAAFLEVSAQLAPDEIAGFIRYEIGPDGAFYYSTIHGPYFWDPASIRRRGPYLLAHYTNQHSGAFVITRDQLKRAIAAGAMDRPPRIGRYDMLCTAATEPYVDCGMTKLVPVSHIEDFRLAHLPNIYLGKIGVVGREMEIQFRRIMDLADNSGGPDGRRQLFPTGTRLESIEWDKSFFEPRRSEVIELLPAAANSVLSVGCGWGLTEEAIGASGRQVTAIPLDAVIAASAESRGIRTLPPDFDAAFEALDERRFDAIVLLEVLEHLADPLALLRRLAGRLAPGGTMLVGLHHFGDVACLRRRFKGDADLKRIGAARDFEELRFRPLVPGRVRAWLAESGLADLSTAWRIPETRRKYERGIGALFRPWLAKGAIVTGKRRT
jgi:SAM-dependent methyltransferase